MGKVKESNNEKRLHFIFNWGVSGFLTGVFHGVKSGTIQFPKLRICLTLYAYECMQQSLSFLYASKLHKIHGNLSFVVCFVKWSEIKFWGALKPIT